MSRLTRKEMKRDEVREGLVHLVDYVRDHGRTLVIGLGVVALAAVAVVVWLAWRGHRSSEANVELTRALEIHSATIDADDPRPGDPDDPSFATEEARAAAARTAFETVYERFGGTSVGAVAASYLADMAARDGDLPRARELWTEAASGSTALAAQSLVNRMAADRAEGRAEDVLAELRTMVGNESALLPQVVVLDQMATVLVELERTEEARDTYQRIIDEFPGTSQSRRAQQQVSSL